MVPFNEERIKEAVKRAFMGLNYSINNFEQETMDQRLLNYDFNKIQQVLDFNRDNLLGFRSLETLTERYFYSHDGRLRESPKAFWMRVSMGLALQEEEKETRARGAQINSTRVESQGVVPFLKIANDTTVAINRSGKRRGATCAYQETWHLDIEDFLDQRRNTGDERRRTHDMNTANWIPDLFMSRIKEKGEWTLFSPSEAPDLHDLYGRAFKERYEHYETLAKQGKMAQHKTLEAEKLLRKMLTRLFETGHPWITFKDPSNIRSP